MIHIYTLHLLKKQQEKLKDGSWSADAIGMARRELGSYGDEEHCYIIEGKVTVEGPRNVVNLIAGDYVIFPKGLKCVWKVKQSIKKYYMFK